MYPPVVNSQPEAAAYASAVSLNNQGVALAREYRLQDAIARFRTALALCPDFAEAHVNLGVALEQNEEFAEAALCYERALAIEPLNPLGHLNLGIVLEKQGNLNEAVRQYRRLLALRPELAEGHRRLGMALSALSQWDAAEPALREAARLEPGNLHTHYHWGISLQKTRRLCEAEEVYRRTLWREDAASRGNAGTDRTIRARLLNELGNVLLELGRPEEAVECFRQAVLADPADAGAHSNWAYAMHYCPETTQRDILAVANEWGKRHGPESLHSAPPMGDDLSPTPERRMRIGYVAPDVGRHPARFFFEPVLECHDRSRFEVFVYAEMKAEDDDATRWSHLCEHWLAIGGTDDAAVAERIRWDRIDVLVDLMGHSGWHRLKVFARRPAARQATWMGYPSTTGLPAMDWRITDAIVDPPGSEAFNSEKLLRLPRVYQCYKPSPGSPDVNELPMTSNRFVTFGCLNNPCKVTPKVIETWAKILEAVAGSRLVVLFNGREREAAATRSRFAAAGTNVRRLILIPRVPLRLEYLKLYHRIDISLDPFPYNGCTTSCDSLWMGVPVVTLCGETTVSRVGAMLLEAVGLNELVAETLERYVAIARSLAADIQRLRDLRRQLRNSMSESPLGDARTFIGNLEAAFQKIAISRENEENPRPSPFSTWL
jgi:predicted O-linked N-acetylglucosamine transferase (SPINDLY family)